MFKKTFQGSDYPTFLSILDSTDSKPLDIWDRKVGDEPIKRILDNYIQSKVLELVGTDVTTTYITCPEEPWQTLGIKLPFLGMIIKKLKNDFTLEVQVLDDANVRRSLRASTFENTITVEDTICTMPLKLYREWNQVQLDLADFTQIAYDTNYVATLRVQIHANCRIRRVYFTDRLYSGDELSGKVYHFRTW